MVSAAQELANRSNAQKSTGPRTAEGKAVVAQNAVKHGLLAKEIVIKGEDPGEFEFYRDQMLAELAPAGQMESMLAQRIVGLAWRLRRAERLQAAAFDKLEDQSKPPELVLSPEQASRLLAAMAAADVHPPEVVDAGPAVGRRAVQDFAQERILDRLLVYERRIEHSLYRTMGEFRKQRLLREIEPPAEGGVTEVSSGNWEVSSEENAASSPPSLPTPDFTLETSPEPPHGGTTNVPDAQEPSCQTNPISGGVSSLTCEVVGEQSRVAESSCETKPISAGSNVGGTPNGTEGQKPACETKPISIAAKKDPVPYVPIFRRRR
jgi:hypothetical protein